MAFDGALWFLEHQLVVLESMIATGREISQRVKDDVTTAQHIIECDGILEEYWPMRPAMGICRALELKVEMNKAFHDGEIDFNQ